MVISSSRTSSGSGSASSTPRLELSSSTSPMACTRRWSLGTRLPSERPVVPSSPVRVAIWERRLPIWRSARVVRPPLSSVPASAAVERRLGRRRRVGMQAGVLRQLLDQRPARWWLTPGHGLAHQLAPARHQHIEAQCTERDQRDGQDQQQPGQAHGGTPVWDGSDAGTTGRALQHNPLIWIRRRADERARPPRRDRAAAAGGPVGRPAHRVRCALLDRAGGVRTAWPR
mmetsp:Transcript_59447/g.140626  ORF Transcript_59447/g.140626 Transcript_59447/m.140626 type:complete len:229 (+) Transcript_59447:517-1203(+)